MLQGVRCLLLCGKFNVIVILLKSVMTVMTVMTVVSVLETAFVLFYDDREGFYVCPSHRT